MCRIPRLVDLLSGACLALAIAGCTMSKERPCRSVGDVWEEPTSPPLSSPPIGRPDGKETPGAAKEAPPLPIATVNGKPINRAQMLDLLIRTRAWACWSS